MALSSMVTFLTEEQPTPEKDALALIYSNSKLKQRLLPPEKKAWKGIL